jgi:Flp pilus assembly secretin CpaC
MFARQFAICAALLVATPATAEDTISPTCLPMPSQIAPTPIRPVSLTESVQVDSATANVADAATQGDDAQEVLVHMQLLKISLTKLHELGVDFAYSPRDSGGRNRDVSSEAANTTEPRPMPADAQVQSAQFGIIDHNQVFLEFLKYLQQNNLAKVLAAPNMAVVCGRSASLSIGGEFPIPSAKGSGSAVEFQKYGTEVKILASALEHDKIRLDVHLRVRELDDAHSVILSGTRVPAFTVRECCSSFDMSFGQTAVLAGLIENHTESISTGAGVKEEPLETKMLLAVTPEKVPSLARK